LKRSRTEGSSFKASPRKTLTDPMKYVDLTYYEKALGKR
jgi:hypothetical protein